MVKNITKGVIFRKNDYAGFLRRTLILFIDSSAIILLLIIISIISDILNVEARIRANLILSWFIFAVLYFTIIKKSKFKTLGYQICGVRIVDIKGEKPSFYKMFIRFVISLIGPFQLPYDIIYLLHDENRQSLRDKFAGTYVVRKNAKPIYENVINVNYYFIYGFIFLFDEVQLNKD